jgi:hypothetical protein
MARPGYFALLAAWSAGHEPIKSGAEVVGMLDSDNKIDEPEGDVRPGTNECRKNLDLNASPLLIDCGLSLPTKKLRQLRWRSQSGRVKRVGGSAL